MSFSCINKFFLAVTVKAPLSHLLKVPYKTTNIRAQKLHGQPLTKLTYMSLTPMIVILISNTYPDMYAFNQMKLLTNLQNHMLPLLHQNNNPSLIQILLP